MEHTVYSFLDLSGSLNHPTLGNYVFIGKGIGSVTLTLATERTAHSVAADGVVMVTKKAGMNGTIAIQCLQVSEIHKWLMKAANTLYLSDTSVWAEMTAKLRNTSDGTSHTLTGMSFGKTPDKAYASDGAMVTWTLFVAQIENY